MTDKDKYLQDLRDRIDAEKSKHENSQENFKSATGSTENKAALTAISTITDQDAAAKALVLVNNKQEDVAVRILALKKVVTAMSDNPVFLQLCLNLLQDKTNDPALRKAALDVLATLSFSSKQFAAFMADYMAVLRTLLDDPDTTLREMAAETLALNKDEYVQRRLLAELNTSEEKIVQRAKAIQLLGHDIHAEHFPLVKKILQEKTATEVEKIEAIHVLAKDPSSKDLLKDFMMDKNQQKEVRLTSASALQAAQPEEFINVAKEVILNEKEDKDVRVLCLNGIMQHIDSDALQNDDQFLERVSKIRTLSLSTELKKVSKKYVDRMNIKRKGKK